MRFPTTPMCDGALLAAFEPTTRDTDVFVATAAKAGQTWLLALLHHLRTRGRDPGFSGLGALGVTPWLELPWDPDSAAPYDREARLAGFAALPDPRVFKMHVPYDEIPRPPGSSAKVMTITRDPRDLPWSMYCHMLAMREEVRGPFVADFDAFFEGWLERGYVFRVVRSFWAHRDDPGVLWLRYEDLQEDLPREARRCVAFLGWDLTEADVARACA
ncbi:MAG: sulfotransferase domain-containing protein, partial [Deltaproteobacteria bacterium]|nr:sulfotransferase domain-containing protein [Deltaproteobacteria bacterium]